MCSFGSTSKEIYSLVSILTSQRMRHSFQKQPILSSASFVSREILSLVHSNHSQEHQQFPVTMQNNLILSHTGLILRPENSLLLLTVQDSYQKYVMLSLPQITTSSSSGFFIDNKISSLHPILVFSELLLCVSQNGI